ncbi:MAG: hemolysin family protein [Nitrospinota bacterium]|nr:hemolysin family protein [Nitrospinota bacterium]
MDDIILPRSILLGILLGFSAFFAACEAAFFSLNQAQLASMKDTRGRGGQLINILLEKPRELLVTIYIGNELVNIAISALATSIALNMFGDNGLAIAIGVGTFLILLFGEIIPKSLSLNFAEKFALFAARPLNLFYRLVLPIQKLFTRLAEIFMSLIGVLPKNMEDRISDEEFTRMIKMGKNEGVIDHDESELIHNVMEFGEKTVADVMTPKIDMFTLKANDTMEDILPKILENFYARVPVYDESEETILGILLTKALIRHRHQPKESFNLKGILQPAISVPETRKIKDMLQDFKKMKRHMAIVLDEFGSVSGLVTLEDILEELVGEIDSETRQEESTIIKITEKRFRLTGTCSIPDFNERFNCELPNGDITTVGGFVFGLFGRVPRSGESISHDRFKFRVEKMKGARILSLHLTLSSPKPSDANQPREAPKT